MPASLIDSLEPLATAIVVAASSRTILAEPSLERNDATGRRIANRKARHWKTAVPLKNYRRASGPNCFRCDERWKF
jgi:hypothetical protein